MDSEFLQCFPYVLYRFPEGRAWYWGQRKQQSLRRRDHREMSRHTRSFLCNVLVPSPGVFLQLREASSLLIREEVVNGLLIRSPPGTK